MSINNEIEKKLWSSADQLRANSKLKASEYSVPVLGLIFLRFADHKFGIAETELAKTAKTKGSRRSTSKTDYQARGVMYLPETARYSCLLRLPEGENISKAINEAMKAIEAENEELKDVLPKTYTRIDNDTLIALLKTFSEIPMDVEGDMFGNIYEYFLGEFARSEGQRGGEFFTPTSLVKLMVEVIEPYHGRILDPACGSGGMFVQSARFVHNHKMNPNQEIAIYGQEKVAETVRLCKMNLAVHGLSGDVKQANTYYENAQSCRNRFDFVLANPPFNVDGVDKEKIKDDPRYPFGLPINDNANYIWIQEFYSALNDKGRAGFVMANSASDARGSELEIRKKLIQDRVVDVMISIGPNFFYTVTLPCTLWFFDKGKRLTNRGGRVLFIDARNIFRQVDRAHREFTPEQIEFIANIVRLCRGEQVETANGSEDMIKEKFPESKYGDIPGLCRVVLVEEIEAQGWSLNPGRYVGVTEKDEDEFDFIEKLTELNAEFESLNLEARDIEERIRRNVEILVGSKNELEFEEC
jgi:type I restriction enzyme M protein